MLIVAGERSGDLYGAGLLEALKKRRPEVEPFGVGGEAMARAGTEILADVAETGVVGIVEVAARLRYFLRLKRTILNEAASRRAKVAILIDFSGFNVRLGKALHRMGVPIAWYISPQVWAWRAFRAKTLGRIASKILVLFPFEETFYRNRGIEATCVGHPLATKARESLDRDQILKDLDFDPSRPILSLLPGSRIGEVSRLAPILADCLAPIRQESGAQFLLSPAPGFPADHLSCLLHHQECSVATLDMETALAVADLTLVASGTATLQAALAGTPMIVLYRVNPLTFALVRRLVKVQYAAMPNILLDETLVPELLQANCRPDRIVKETISLLKDDSRRRQVSNRLLGIRRSLARPNPYERAAAEVAKLLPSSPEGVA